MDVIINDVIEVVPANSKPLVTEGDALLNLLVSLDYNPASLPLAALLANYHHLDAGNWLVIEPVHWQATHNDAMIVACGRELLLTGEESRQWFDAVSHFLREDGFLFHYHNAHTWLIKANDKPSLNNTSAFSLLHKSLMPVFGQMDITSYWQKLLTELQMFLSSHPLNQQRQNALPINGVWVYGQGVFKIPETQSIITDDEQLIACYPERVVPLDFTQPLKNNSILLLNDKNKLDFSKLPASMTRHALRWFWNNTAYSTSKKSWWNWF